MCMHSLKLQCQWTAIPSLVQYKFNQRDEREDFGKKKKCMLFSAVTHVLKISIQCHIQEDHNLHIYCCRNLKCDDRYFVLF
jgi:hypothetical protein